MAGHARPQLQASIVPIFHKRAFLEKHNIDIVDYAKRFCSENSKQGYVITRHDIEWYWEGNTRAEYDTRDPSHDRLINQARCPKFESYWMEKSAVTALQAKKVLQGQEGGMWPLKPTQKEKKYNKSALILGNHTERWIVPDVSLMAIDDVSFSEFEQNIRTANAGDACENLDKSKLFQLWGTLIEKVYDFVPKEVQIEKLKDAFSRHPPTAEPGLEEFFGTSSKKRKTTPNSEDDTFDRTSVGARKGRRVSIGEFQSKTHSINLASPYLFNEHEVRTFDNKSTLDPTLKPILRYNYKTSPRATVRPIASASPESSGEADGGKSEEKMVDPAQKRVQELERELAELKVVKSEIEHNYQSERGMRRGAESKILWLERDLQNSQDLVAQLEKRSIQDL